MIHVDKSMMFEFRCKTRCEVCGKATAGAHPHHIFTRGAGRLDIRCNLISLCVYCHTSTHAGREPNREKLLVIAARRERLTAERIAEIVHRLRRQPKEYTVCACGGPGCEDCDWVGAIPATWDNEV